MKLKTPGAEGLPGEGRRQPSPVAVSLQLAGAGLILISAFVPWVRSHALFLTIPVRGAETDYGRLFPLIALVVAALLAYQWSFGWRHWAHGVVLLLGIAALTVAIVYGVQVTQRVQRIAKNTQNQPGAPLVLTGGALFSIEFDIGYYLTLLGAGGLIAGAVAGLREQRRDVQ